MMDQALMEAVNTFHQKQQTIDSLATVISHLLPNVEPFPFVNIPSLQEIVNDMRLISPMQTVGFIPFTLSHQKEAFESHAQDYFQQRHYTQVGKCIFQIVNGTCLPNDGVTTWGSPHEILTPAFEVESGDHPILLSNIHSDKKRGKPIHVLMERVALGNPTNRCTTISEVINNHKEATRGPSSANWAPVFPANNPTTLVGITGSLIV